MDPAALAAVATRLLVPVLNGGLNRTGESLAGTAFAQVGKLHRAIKKKFASDSYNMSALQGAEERPDPLRLKHLEDVVREVLKTDHEFAGLVASLVDEAKAAGARIVQAEDSGAVAAGDMTITGQTVAGRDLYIGVSAGGAEPAGRRSDVITKLFVIVDAFWYRARELVVRIDNDADVSAVREAHALYLEDWHALLRANAAVVIAGPAELATRAQRLTNALSSLSSECDRWFAAYEEAGGRPTARWSRYNQADDLVDEARSAFVALVHKLEASG